MMDYLEQGLMINGAYYAGKLKAATPENRKKEARRADLRYSALGGQRPCPHGTSCHDCCD